MNWWIKIGLVTILLVLLGLGLYWGWWWYRLQRAQNYDLLLQTLYERNTVPLLQPEQVGDLSQYLILDVRTEAEYQVSHLPNSHFVNASNPDFEQLEQLHAPKRPVLVYCSVGYRSEQLGQQLLNKGWASVYNLYGGLFQWANQGRPLVDANNATTTLVHGFGPTWGRWVKDSAAVVYE